MKRSLLIGCFGAATALAAVADSINRESNSSSKVQDAQGVAAVAAVAEAQAAAEKGPFGLPSLSDLPGFGWPGPRPSSGRGGNGDAQQAGGRGGNRGPQQASGRGGTRDPQLENNNNRRIWQPRVGQPFQIILSSSIMLQNGKNQGQKLFQLVPERVDVFDIDLWDNSAETIEKLHASGRKVICYFSAGTSEDWRADFKNIKPQDMGASLPLWKGERWLDIRQRSVWNVMQKRIELASKRGCDAIDPDNIDVYDNEKGGGFRRPLTKSDSITYVRKLAREAKRYGMSIGLKNSGDILKSVQDDIHFAVNEECAELKECDIYKDFLYPKDKNRTPKPVFHIEYVSKKAKPGTETPDTNAPKDTAAASPKEAPKPLPARDTTHGAAIKTTQAETNLESPNGVENGIADLYDIFNKLWPNAPTPFIRRMLCLGTPPTGVGSRMSTVIKEMNLGGWVMYCDGGTADTRTLLPNGQTPKKGASDGGGKPQKGKGTEARTRFDFTAAEAEFASDDSSSSSADGEDVDSSASAEERLREGEGEVGQEDADLVAAILYTPETQLSDEVWNSDVGPILEEDLEPNPEKKSRGARKDMRGPDGYR
ncbi:hypothetical protein BLS_009835 [Venturia inaequalis]|uniref:alpha-galactosidase n=1 Tax=Venturia inaequalis TaxID=5025 RepID=A0A8H3V300_VENIN|nr:hypothetical protein BLS_009835 [Venturia inaequalis]RDI77546.1 RNA polymerase II subunit A C-terminal domain phosphatase [Venturia inaequalis]